MHVRGWFSSSSSPQEGEGERQSEKERKKEGERRKGTTLCLDERAFEEHRSCHFPSTGRAAFPSVKEWSEYTQEKKVEE
jgi:hypothetical protein